MGSVSYKHRIEVRCLSSTLCSESWIYHAQLVETVSMRKNESGRVFFWGARSSLPQAATHRTKHTRNSLIRKQPGDRSDPPAERMRRLYHQAEVIPPHCSIISCRSYPVRSGSVPHLDHGIRDFLEPCDVRTLHIVDHIALASFADTSGMDVLHDGLELHVYLFT